MKSTDLRAKARAIFGSAIAEPMPNQPNGAKALQQRANARPIPTYKVGGVVKKAAGGMPVSTGSPTAMRSTASPTAMRSTGSPTAMRSTGSPVSTAMPVSTKSPTGATPPGMSSKLVKKKAEGGKMTRRSPEADDVLMSTRRGQQMLDEQRRREAAKAKADAAKRAKADKLLGIPAQKSGGKAGCYKKGGGVQTSADTAKKLATEMGGMKKGGKPKDGLAVMIAIGKPMKGMKKPVKRAVGGAGKTRKGMC